MKRDVEEERLPFPLTKAGVYYVDDCLLIEDDKKNVYVK